jgi:hypothetical protein
LTYFQFWVLKKILSNVKHISVFPSRLTQSCHGHCFDLIYVSHSMGQCFNVSCQYQFKIYFVNCWFALSSDLLIPYY